MRKSFLMVAVSILLCGITFNVAMAQEVGEKMPSLEGYAVTYSGTWQSPDWTKNGTSVKMAKPEAEDKYFVVYNICKVRAEIPFGIYDIETNILYLDNAPTDGVIDKVVPNPTNYVYEDAPDCK